MPLHKSPQHPSYATEVIQGVKFTSTSRGSPCGSADFLLTIVIH